MAQVRISRDICRGCRYCILICPKSVIGIGEKANSKGYRFAVVVNPIDALVADFVLPVV